MYISSSLRFGSIRRASIYERGAKIDMRSLFDRNGITIEISNMFPPSMSTGPAHQAPDPDASIRLTDTDAAIARLSAVHKGYIHDPYIKHLVPRAHLQQPRPPLINIGTFVRGTAIDELVDQWLAVSSAAGVRCQIVSLGAGSDTRFWRVAVRRCALILQRIPLMGCVARLAHTRIRLLRILKLTFRR